MKLGILHLSDIHLKENLTENHALKRKEKIYDVFKNFLKDVEVIFITITGDVAFSGHETEYTHACSLIEFFIQSIKKDYGLTPIILSIPGNHDCDFRSKNSVRNSVIKGLQESWYRNIDEEIIECCCSVQKNYFDFEDNLSHTQLTELYRHNLLKIYEYKQKQYNIIFNCYNTSWISKLHEEEGQLAFPTSYFPQEIFQNKSDLTINLIHHPINWQNNVHHRELRKQLEETGDLILSGHEHENNQRSVKEKNGPTTFYLEAGALQEENHVKSCFNFYSLDLEKETYDHLEFKFEEGNYKLITNLQNQKYDHRFGLSKKDFYLSKSYKDFLNSTNAQFVHSQVEEIYLDDIYVHPKLRHLTSDDKEGMKVPKIIDSNLLFTKIKGEKSNILWSFVGDESSGKTSIAKIIFKHFYECNYVPIFIKGDILNQINYDKLNKIIKIEYCDQYEKKCEAKYDTIEKEKLLLIIDDFQNCPVRGRFRIQLVENLLKISPNIVFTGNALVLFEAIEDEKNHRKVDCFKEFEQFTILELGADLRYDLINNWNKLGRDIFSDEDRNELYVRNDNADAQIKATIGNSFIPSYPLYILTLLQSLEVGTSNPDYSLFGYYYEYLITTALNDAVNDKDSLQFYHNIAAELSYFLFDNKLKNIDKESFAKFYKSYSEKYKTNEDINKVIGILTNAKIIRIENFSFITFSYRYVYYYYVAKFFSTKISSPPYRDQISKMCKRLYREEFSHIIVFLTHLSKDQSILNEIYENAKEQFSEVPITRLESDINKINNLVNEIPQLVIEAKSIEENRAAKFLSQVEEEELEREFESQRSKLEYDLNEDISRIDFLSRIIRSIKTFELLGQITKKYWGSIEGEDKYKYAKETFDLSLRTLNHYFDSILAYKDGIIEAVKAIAIRKNLEDVKDIKEATDAYIFKLSCMAAYGSIHRVSNSIGHKKLKDTFDEIIKSEPILSYKLIDIAIKLHHTPVIPEGDITKLTDDPAFHKNYLPQYLLQNFVYNHFTLYSSDYKEKQQMLSKLKISITKSREADYGSSVKKR